LRWLLNGAWLVGVVIAIAKSPYPWSGRGIAANLGYVLGGGLAALLFALAFLGVGKLFAKLFMLARKTTKSN
jgi:hypothetical protein